MIRVGVRHHHSLDLSAVFDTVDHEILQTEFRVEGMPLTWLRSYLDGRTQYVKIGKYQSTAILLSSSRSVSLRGQYWDPSCLPFRPVQLRTSLQAMVFSTTSMLTTRSFALRPMPTTHPPDCLCFPHVLPTSDSGTCRTACSSTRTNQKH